MSYSTLSQYLPFRNQKQSTASSRGSRFLHEISSCAAVSLYLLLAVYVLACLWMCGCICRLRFSYLMLLAPKFNSITLFYWSLHQLLRSCGNGFLAHDDCRAAPLPVSSRLNLYTLDCLLIDEQIAALQPDTVLAAWKGLYWIQLNK